MDKKYTYNSHRHTYTVTIRKAQYENRRTALLLESVEDGSPVATATVNVPEIPLGADQVLIKTWGENEAMLPFLVLNHVVLDLGLEVPCGYVTARLCRLLI